MTELRSYDTNAPALMQLRRTLALVFLKQVGLGGMSFQIASRHVTQVFFIIDAQAPATKHPLRTH